MRWGCGFALTLSPDLTGGTGVGPTIDETAKSCGVARRMDREF